MLELHTNQYFERLLRAGFYPYGSTVLSDNKLFPSTRYTKDGSESETCISTTPEQTAVVPQVFFLSRPLSGIFMHLSGKS